jgi:hypothetical protein
MAAWGCEGMQLDVIDLNLSYIYYREETNETTTHVVRTAGPFSHDDSSDGCGHIMRLIGWVKTFNFLGLT